MDTADGYVGDDGSHYKNPCTSNAGKQKERWQNERAAWFVAELVSLGLHRSRGNRKKLYAYRCPKCHGWHLASCKTKKHYREHDAGIARLREELNVKSPQNATEKGHKNG